MDVGAAAANGRKTRRFAGGIGLIAAAGAIAGCAHAAEGGASFYLLGSGGPEAAITPPFKGVYFDNTTYVYDASAKAGQDFVFGGNVVAGAHVTLPADFATFAWVPTTNFVGGTVVFGGALAFGAPIVNVSAVITGPLGRQFAFSANQSAVTLGDPLLTAGIGWAQGDWHEELSTLVNIPIGPYFDGGLANVSFHRWIDDVSGAVTWHDDKSGWDLSSKTGVTFNGENPADHYRTGTEFHAEASLEKTLSPAVALGVQAYWYDQITGDSGAGATLGPFKGRVTGVGGTLAYNFKWLGMPATLRLRGFDEFGVKNRLQGSSYWLELSVPLVMKVPPGAPQG